MSCRVCIPILLILQMGQSEAKRRLPRPLLTQIIVCLPVVGSRIVFLPLVRI